MSDEHPTGAALRRQMELLNARIEMLKQHAATAAGTAIDWQRVDDVRCDLDRAFDSLDDEVDAAIKRVLEQLVEALKRKFEEAGLGDGPEGA